MLTALYIHIPFCNQICTYCDFVKEVASLEKKNAYLNALISEFLSHKEKYSNIKTIYIGGGTPSALSIEQLDLLLHTITSHIDMSKVIEFSIETNPNDLTKDKVSILKKHGINRVSIGVQTFNQSQLTFLNRSHKVEDIEIAINNVKSSGITNINVDMIFSLIGQTKEELEIDIKKVTSLDITHISYYSLILEDRTRLMHLYDKGEISINDEDKEGMMYNLVLDSLVESGFEHYEISNFCKDNLYSHHNVVYWTNKDYLGLGAGAHSLLNDKRYYNVSSVKKYIENVESGDLKQTSYERNALQEELMMGLRLLKGVNVSEINKKYNIDLFTKYDKLHYFINENLLQLDKGYLHFTKKGLFVGNVIFGHFLEG